MSEVLADTATKCDMNLNFTQFYCLTLYRITTNKEIFFISHSSFLVPRNSFVYRFNLVFSRHQFQVSMLQVLFTASAHLQQTAAAQFQMLLRHVSILLGAKEILRMKSSFFILKLSCNGLVLTEVSKVHAVTFFRI